MSRKRQRQQLIFQQQQQQSQEHQFKQEKKQEEPQKEKVTIIMREGVCMKSNKVKTIHKIQYGIFINRARRRYNKAAYFSEQA